MKKYTAKFRRVFKRGKYSRKLDFTEEIEACTFKEARDIIRTKYDNAISIDISEVPNSFRENTREEDLAYIKKYKKDNTNEKLSNDLGKQDSPVRVLHISEGSRGYYKKLEGALEINGDIEINEMSHKEHVSVHSNDDIFDTVMYMVKESPEIQDAVKDLVKFRPKSIAIEDKIKEVLINADLIDYKEDFLVRFTYGNVEVVKVQTSKKVNPHTNKKELCVVDNYGDVIV